MPTYSLEPDEGVAVTLAVMPNRAVATSPHRVAHLDDDEDMTEDFADRYDDLTYRCRMVSPPQVGDWVSLGSATEAETFEVVQRDWTLMQGETQAVAVYLVPIAEG